MNDATRIVVKPNPGITPKQARDARARAWAFVFECFDHHEKEAVSGRGGKDDASDELHKKKGVGHDLTSNPCSVESVKPGKEMKG
jgi:hypothetical protein